MSEQLKIKSYLGIYQVDFLSGDIANIKKILPERPHYIVDATVWKLYEKQFAPLIGDAPVLTIEALETNKALEKFPEYIEALVAKGLKRGCSIVGIGGGIIEDITCFVSSIVFRGLPWHFLPTTLLAQADSCIGSKSSINCGRIKNVVGNFYPPKMVGIHLGFLDTLQEKEILSGIGEMLKVHMLDGRASFAKIAADYDKMRADRSTLLHYVRASLEIKKRFIEEDEFDRGVRNLLNYGHSFGHAIETATQFGIPHGIAVTIGMDMANYYSAKTGKIPQADFEFAHKVMQKNYAPFKTYDIPLEPFVHAIERDKKNVSSELALILPLADMKIEKVFVPPGEEFKRICKEFFATGMRV